VASVVKVLQRSLFNKQVHEHYGTGIASGLADERPGFAMGGRVNLQQGGDPDIAAIIAEGKAKKTKEKLFDGRTKITSAPGSFGFLSVLGQDYQLQLFQKLKEQGLNKETFKSLPKDQQELIAQTINDEILNSMTKKYNVSFGQLNEHFGGKNVINNALYSIKTQFNYPDSALEKNMISLQGNYENNLASIGEENPGIFDPLPSIVQQQTTETDESDMGDDTGTDDGTDEDTGDVMQAGLMGLDRTGDEFRQQYVDYLQDLQNETKLADIRRREAVEAGFFNLGAADPVQEGESLVQAGIKAFRDPMANLRAQEAVRAEDIYKRGADTLDEALSPSESREVLLLEELVKAGIPRDQAVDIITNREIMRSQEQRQLLDIPEIGELIAEQMAGDPNQGIPGKSAEEAVKEILGGAGLTQPTILQQNIKDGGRVGLQEGGEALAEAITPETPGPTSIDAASPEVSPMSFEELRKKLPSYIDDEVVQLLASNPMALMELAQAQTDRDLRAFEKKYNVDVTMPLAETEEETDVGVV